VPKFGLAHGDPMDPVDVHRPSGY